MLKVAIVGNIAAGKTTVEKILLEKGYKVFDTDNIAHKLLNNNPDVELLFGTTNRKDLAKIVFEDKQKLEELEKIIHPLVKKELENIFSKDFDIVFISVPQLFEAGFESMFDKILFINADKDLRKKRLIARNNLTIEEAEKRIKAQGNETEKIKKSDYVIENNLDLSNLRIQLEGFLTTLTN